MQSKDDAFWDRQPVTQRCSERTEEVGEIDTSLSRVDASPYKLPESFEWSDVDITNPDDADAVYTLLRDHYTEDNKQTLRFHYSVQLLQWALQPPGHRITWLVGVRVFQTKKLVGFISCVPAAMKTHTVSVGRTGARVAPVVQVNFLCVHKKLRTKRLAPLLIRELTRRVNCTRCFQAVFTGIELHFKPVAHCSFAVRPLNIQKLIDIHFFNMDAKLTKKRIGKLYALPVDFNTPGLRPLERKDCEHCCQMLNDFLSKYEVCAHFSVEEFCHYFLPREGIIYCYVVEDVTSRTVTDMFSFYEVSSSLLKSEAHKSLRAAYGYYYFNSKTPLVELFSNALVIAKNLNFDMYNTLNVMDLSIVHKNLRFLQGVDVYYYFYNWKCPSVDSSQMGLFLI